MKSPVVLSLKGCLVAAVAVAAATGCSPAAGVDGGMDVPSAVDTFRPDTSRADTFVPPRDTYVPPEDTFVPPDTFMPPEDTFMPPADTFMPPADTFVPRDTFMPPADTFVPPMDAVADVPNRDSAVADVPPAPGCNLMVDGTLAIPGAGMTTTVMTSLNAMGMGGMNAGTSCSGATGGSERIFRLSLAAQTSVIITANAANAMTDTVLAIRRNCASSGTEVACNDDIGGGNLNSSVRATLDAGEYFVLLDEYGDAAAATGGAVTLTLRTSAPVPAGACGTAPTLMAGVGVMGNTDVNGSEIAPNMCNNFTATGPELYYTFSIPPNTVATINAVPSGMPAWAPYLRVFNTCMTQDMCSATNLAAMAGGTATVSVRNDRAVAQTIYVSVGSSTRINGGAFTITATTMAIPAVAYSVTQAAMASCDDISMSPRDPAVVGDDAVSMFAPLPFAFSYHRAAVTHWAANTNGLAQLGSMADMASSAYSNAMLPVNTAPSGALAVFWDDLEVGPAPQGVRAQVLGAMPNRRLVIDWTNTHLGAANSLHFQVKLFETTNVIEYHYCAMAADPMAPADMAHTGSSATIGLQSVDRMVGQTFTFNRVNAIGAGSMPVTNMIRWTPNP
jgi:hypothetical protein